MIVAVVTPDNEYRFPALLLAVSGVLIAGAIAGTVLWVVALVEIAKRSGAEFRAAGSDKTRWVVAVVLTGAIGAAIWRRSDTCRRLSAGAAPSGTAVGGGWYPDPSAPGGWRWVELSWTPPRVATAAVFRPIGATEAIRAGARLARERWRPLAWIGVVALVLFNALVVVASVVNGLAFDYDFYGGDAPPSPAAEVAESITWLVQIPLMMVVLAGAYGAFCAVAWHGVGARQAWRLCRRSFASAWWSAIPAFFLTGCAVLLVILGPFTVGRFSAVAIERIARPSARGGPNRRMVGRLRIAGIIPSGLLAVAWAVSVGFKQFLARHWLVDEVVGQVFSIAAVATMAWVAAISSVIHRDATRRSPWPAPAVPAR